MRILTFLMGRPKHINSICGRYCLFLIPPSVPMFFILLDPQRNSSDHSLLDYLFLIGSSQPIAVLVLLPMQVAKFQPMGPEKIHLWILFVQKCCSHLEVMREINMLRMRKGKYRKHMGPMESLSKPTLKSPISGLLVM